MRGMSIPIDMKFRQIGHTQLNSISNYLSGPKKCTAKKGSQINIAVLDFSKAFDTVPIIDHSLCK